MSTVLYVKQKEKSLLLGIDTEGERSGYTVSYTLYAEIGSPVRGEELSEGALEKIAYCDESYRAKKKALSLLSFADNSERTLIHKLTVAGFRRRIAEEITAEMTTLGYINEQKQLERLILEEANHKLSGPKKILLKLVNKGYSQTDAKRVMQSLIERCELDFTRNADLLAEKKLGENADTEERRALLYKNGYKV